MINREATWSFFNPWTSTPLALEIAGATLTLIPIALQHTFDDCADAEGRGYFLAGIIISMMGSIIQMANNVLLRVNNKAHRLYFFGESISDDRLIPQKQDHTDAYYTGDTKFNAWSEWFAAIFPPFSGIGICIFSLCYLFTAAMGNNENCDILKFTTVLGLLISGLLSAAGTDRLSSANSQLTALKKFHNTQLEFLSPENQDTYMEIPDPDNTLSARFLNPSCSCRRDPVSTGVIQEFSMELDPPSEDTDEYLVTPLLTP